MKSIVNSIWSL